MRVVGVDENGLGPMLGPLVVTCVSLDVVRYGSERLRKIGQDAGITDSKASAGFGKMAHCEGLALAAIELMTGERPRDADDVLRLVSLDGLLSLRAPCPKGTAPQCWRPLRVPAFGGDVADGHARLGALRKKRVSLVRVRSQLACAHVLNRDVGAAGTKIALNLSYFERLLLDARAASETELHAVCGMIGGYRQYATRFSQFGARAVTTVKEEKGVSAYRVEGLGDVRFEVDSDAGHLPVALASMIGKYLRELWMERKMGFYQSHDASLPKASGYHDPVTKRFVAESAALRTRLGIAEPCFVRAC